jgi:hypothetical protein
MSAHRLAWTGFGATLVVSALAVTLDVLDRPVQPVLRNALPLLVPIGYALMGALIVARQPGNAIGWLYAAVGLSLSLTAGLAQSYAIYTLLVRPGALPGGNFALWLQSPALDSVFLVMMMLLLLLFPNGRPLTPRWRIAVWAAAIGTVLGLSQAFQPFHIDPPLESFQNPYIATGAAATLLGWAGNASELPLLAGVVCGIVSVVLRFRRSRGVERQQLRWFAAAVVAIVVVVLVTITIYLITGRSYDAAVFIASVAMLPAATGIAILRYRLYEIDVIIRRTLVYTVLVVVLAGLYLGGVTLAGGLLRGVTGGSGTIGVTVSTLAVAAAFQPLRTRIQRTIDHRFYRRRYDAARTLEAFSGRLREQVDIETVSGEVLDVVRETLQPAHATLWLRPGEAER